MATYNPYLKGYIADVPKVVFKRCDGFKYNFDELSSATVSANIETTNINAGWSLFPVAVLPGASTFEMNFTVAKFDAGLFALANAVTEDRTFVENSEYVMSVGERYDINNKKIVLDREAVDGSIYIAGMEEGTDFTAASSGGRTTITFTETPSVAFADVVYDYVQTAYETVISNKESAIGECVCMWPVYGSGDECTESAIIGYWVVRVFRARVTQQPGMDTSYKSAATFQFNLQALDAKRNDQGAYSVAYWRV